MLATTASSSTRRDTGVSATLTKGANIALDPRLRRVLVGLGWTPPNDGFQLDLSVLLCGPDGQVPGPGYVVFASQLAAAAQPGGPTAPAGPTATGDDEQIEVDLAAVPGYIDKIVFAASLYSADSRRQTFGQIDHLYIRVSDLDSGAELVRYSLDHDCAGETALAFGELYRRGDGWKFRAVGQGWADGLAGLTRDFGAAVHR